MLSRYTAEVVQKLVERSEELRRKAIEFHNDSQQHVIDSVGGRTTRDARDFTMRLSEVDAVMARLLTEFDQAQAK